MNVSSQQTDNGLIYGVKVLNNGRMRIIQVDANSGQMLNN
jgi:uncharacterized membrane protein YkoI